MTFLSSQLPLLLETLMFASVVYMHLVKKNASIVLLFVLQSAAIVLMLIPPILEHQSALLIAAVVATAVVKIGIAPYFMFRLIRTHQMKFSSNTYLSMPITLLALALIVVLANSSLFQPLSVIASQSSTLLFLAISIILSSILLIINRQGAMSQMVGILSVENGIVALALSAGLEQSPALQLGITFDLFVWICIANVFLTMMYRQIGSLDVTALRQLTDKALPQK